MRFLFSICMVCFFNSSFSQLVEFKPLLTVTGEAYEKVIPDLALIHYRADEKILPRGQLNMTQIEQDKLDIDLKFVDAKDEAIAKGVTVIRNTPDGYTKNVSYIITVSDLSKYKTVLYNLLKLDEGEIVKIEFRTSRLEELRYSAREKAIHAAREKAVALAADLNQSIGKAFEIVEEMSPLINWYEKQPGDVIDQPTNDTYLVQPGFITIPAKVTVSFELN